MKSLACLVLALALGCSSSPSKPAQPSATNPVIAQIERGKSLYVASCAKCHGDGGQGVADKGPPVVGAEAFPLKPRAGAKRDVDFHTAADVFAWTVQHMPGDAPGTLSTDEYLAIFAFDLTANKVVLTAPLDAAAAKAIVLHP